MGHPTRSAEARPSGDTLLQLERQARRQGSGLTAAALIGCWQLEQVWSKGNKSVSSLSSQVLRGLGARLVLEQRGQAEELAIANAVNLGQLELRFLGSARLVGRRPLLVFQFERVELKLAALTLVRRMLPPMAPQRQPFFALIACDPSGWLAARGRGGGLAQWQRRP